MDRSPPQSPIASKTRKKNTQLSPKSSFRKKLGSPKKSLIKTFNRPEESPNDETTLFSPEYTRDDEDYELNFEEDMVPYFHVRILQTYNTTRFAGPAKLPPLEDPEKYTLVLDLDETLVHCSTDDCVNPHVQFELVFGDVTFSVSAKFRPFLKEFLKATSKDYELVVFTASQKVYADVVIDRFDTERLIKHRLYREDCTNVSGNFVKDLAVLGRDLRRTVFIDNSPQAFTFQVNNSIPIISWYSDEDDNELEKMIRILQEIRTYDDVRVCIKEAFNIEELIENLPKSPMHHGY